MGKIVRKEGELYLEGKSFLQAELWVVFLGKSIFFLVSLL